MALSDAKTWFRENIGTEQFDGDEVIRYDHPVGEECPHCEQIHEYPVVERVPVETVYNHHGNAMENAAEQAKSIPDKAAANVRDALSNDAAAKATGHDRFV